MAPPPARPDSRPIAYSAAAMFGGAAFLGVVEELVPGGPGAPLAPALAAVVVAPLVFLAGRRLPPLWMLPLGFAGAGLVASSLAETQVAGDGALLYMLPVIWTAHFFGRRAAAAIVAWVAIMHALALLVMPAGLGNADRWLDTVVCVALVAGTIRWLTERHQRLVERIHAEARMDALTGVTNRRGFEEAYPRVVERARHDGEPVAIVSFDIDHFKRVNDDHGHEAGDRVLAAVGATLHERARVQDLVARVGGEEFVAVLPGADVAEAALFADRMRQAIGRDAGDDRRPRVTVSAGVAYDRNAADAALYAAKRAGRNRTRVDGTLPLVTV